MLHPMLERERKRRENKISISAAAVLQKMLIGRLANLATFVFSFLWSLKIKICIFD